MPSAPPITPSNEVVAFDETPPYAEFDDEQLARSLEREMMDEQIARNLQEREQERHHEAMRNPPSREGAAAGLTSGSVHSQSPPTRRCRRRGAVCSAGIVVLIIAAILIIIFFGSLIWEGLGGDSNDFPPYSDQDWDKLETFQNGGIIKEGLNLKIRNALSSDWDVYFVKSCLGLECCTFARSHDGRCGRGP